VASRAALAAWLAAVPSRAVAPFAASIGMRAVAFEAALCDPFLNVNTPAELAAARRLLEQGG
jgi:molybdopterin-guanine dinucleotide biosynthesis protein A